MFDIFFSCLICLDVMGGEFVFVLWVDMLNYKSGCAAFIDLNGDVVNFIID